jgi:hypothetical protein
VTDIDTAAIRAEAMRGDALQMDVVALCDALDAARLTIKQVRAARDDWHARGYMSCAKELSAVLDGAE